MPWYIAMPMPKRIGRNHWSFRDFRPSVQWLFCHSVKNGCVIFSHACACFAASLNG
jgi:hypothetical protein